jgi:hypothetical protein
LNPQHRVKAGRPSIVSGRGPAMQRMIAVAELVPRTPDCMLGPRHQFIAARAAIVA